MPPIDDAHTPVASVVLQIWRSGDQWAGRILREGIECGRVTACATRDVLESQAIEAGIDIDRVETLVQPPPVA